MTACNQCGRKPQANGVETHHLGCPALKKAAKPATRATGKRKTSTKEN